MDSGEGPWSLAPQMSMDLGVGNRVAALEDVEIAAFVCLTCVLREDRAESPPVARWGRPPRGATERELLVADMQREPPRRDVDLDRVAVLDQRERAPDKGFRRDVQNARAVARAAHTRVRNPQHVADAFL